LVGRKITSSLIMATHLEDSFQSALDYEAEVAYISLTSPLRPSVSVDSEKEDEFDFFTEQSEQEESQQFVFPQPQELVTSVPLGPQQVPTQPALSGEPPLGEETGGLEPTRKPPLLSKLGYPRPSMAGERGGGENLVSRQGSSGLPEQAESAEGTEAKLKGYELDKATSSIERVRGKKAASLSPLTISVAHYTLDTELPSTPRSKLRRIKDAQAPPSPKPRPKLQQEEHLYCMLVVYGSNGCGRTQLVDKLALSNPAVFTKVIPSTTRKMRPNEVADVDFHYLTHQEMKSSLGKGDFMEFIRVHRKGKDGKYNLRKKALTQQASLDIQHPPQLRDFRSSSLPVDPAAVTPPATPPLTKPPLVRTNTEGKLYGSLFDLTDEDGTGEVFGTTYQSLTAATQQGKPCILLNVSTKGAQQLKEAGLQASYVLIQSSRTTPKARRGSGIAEGESKAVKTPLVALVPDYTISFSGTDQAYSDLYSYAFQLVSKLKVSSTSQFQVAQYEWEAMPTVQFEQVQTVPNQKLVGATFSEVLAHFQSADLKHQKGRAKAERSKASFLGRLSKRLQQEKLLVQAMAYCQINEKDKFHHRMLQTVYSKLTGNVLTCRRLGPHWQEIGFTGVDPADDMDKVGLLGVAQLIKFLESPKTASFCKEIFKYCHKDTHIIPFMVMAFEFSQLCLDVLDSGGLNKVCNKRDQVFVVVNEFYMAAFHYYYQNWKSSQKSILQLGLLMQQCGDYCKSHPRQVMHEFDKYLSVNEPQNQLIPAMVPKVEGAFTLFEDIKTQT
jgi:guanylate kinase